MTQPEITSKFNKPSLEGFVQYLRDTSPEVVASTVDLIDPQGGFSAQTDPVSNYDNLKSILNSAATFQEWAQDQADVENLNLKTQPFAEDFSFGPEALEAYEATLQPQGPS